MKTGKENLHHLSANALQILESRYLQSDENGRVCESPDQMFLRVAKAVAKAEIKWSTQKNLHYWEEKFFNVMSQLLFLPNSPTLMNAGTALNQLSACFVLPVEDHLEDIFNTLKLAALIQQSGGGTGFNFSHLRPKNDRMSSTGGTASGPVSFMKIFDTATEHVKQGGKRRGANMGILNIDHPDIEEFISIKKEAGSLRNFNISVGVSEAFMLALQSNRYWKLKHPTSHKTIKTVKAKKLWDHIIENAWKSGDPGLIFFDTINASNPTPLFKIEATNPCGEVPLLSYESCNLGSINISKFINYKSNAKAYLNWTELEEIVAVAIRFLDNVIEVNRYLTPEIKEIALGNRKTGLGVMGWAEALSMLEIPYSSDKAVKLAKQLMKFISEKSFETSKGLAIERGSFKNWKKSIYYPRIPVRNATRTSIAPTGTISIIADTSSSIEPFFALAFQRRHVLQGETMQEINKALLKYLETHGIKSKEIISLIEQTGTLENDTSLPDHIKTIFKTALEIYPTWHLKHQIAFQKFTDNAVSKTINLPQWSTIEDIDLIYQKAWKEKLKGITIFRNNSKESQVLHPGVHFDLIGCKVCT
ncbi:adenosylcobalamin-dependent ribonucleoside-diphosphate reductase [soil metagenome]